MLRSLAILAVTIALTQALLNAPQQERGEQGRAIHDPSKGNVVSSPPAQPPTEFRPMFQAPKWEPKSDPVEQKPNYWKEAFGPAFISNWALVLVGGLAGFLAWRTLKAISKQAELMRQQNEMILSKERGRLHVELDDFSGKQFDDISYIVEASVYIFGPTDVTVDASELWAAIGDPAEPNIRNDDTLPAAMPKVIRANSEPIKILAFIMRNPSIMAGDEGIEDVLSGQKIVYCKGNIIFTNLFDRKYVLRISKRYRIFDPELKLASGKIFGWWENYGDPNDNGEYPLFEIDTSKPQRRGFRWLIRALTKASPN
jgi:hypothetical protein